MMRTEIFGTFGPACASEEMLRKMIDAGVTGMRLNLSHTTLPASENYIRNFQNAAMQVNVKPQILIDMQGPELRVGKLERPMELQEGEQVFLSDTDTCKKKRAIPVPTEVVKAVKAGEEILLDDGKILMQVEDEIFPGGNVVAARVRRAGILQSHKSVKIIGKNIKLPPLTEHDIENITVAKEYGVTALMQPFVCGGADLKYVRKVLKEHSAEDVKIFAKIENRLGVENIEDILPEADVIIIARGDLGNDMPLWELPGVQKEIEAACKKAKKPYIVVTQMLASMERHPVPTRAEVSDIFHAVYHGAWGVMLTGETAVGDYPVEAVQYLANTAKEAEKYIE